MQTAKCTLNFVCFKSAQTHFSARNVIIQKRNYHFNIQFYILIKMHFQFFSFARSLQGWLNGNAYGLRTKETELDPWRGQELIFCPR